VPTGTHTNVNDQQGLAVVLQDAFGSSRANQILAQLEAEEVAAAAVVASRNTAIWSSSTSPAA